MTPKCCENCPSLNAEGYCDKYFKTCPQWLKWFRKEWAEIRKAAQAVKEAREAKEEKRRNIEPLEPWMI